MNFQETYKDYELKKLFAKIKNGFESELIKDNLFSAKKLSEITILSFSETFFKYMLSFFHGFDCKIYFLGNKFEVLKIYFLDQKLRDFYLYIVYLRHT